MWLDFEKNFLYLAFNQLTFSQSNDLIYVIVKIYILCAHRLLDSQSDFFFSIHQQFDNMIYHIIQINNVSHSISIAIKSLSLLDCKWYFIKQIFLFLAVSSLCWIEILFTKMLSNFTEILLLFGIFSFRFFQFSFYVHCLVTELSLWYQTTQLFSISLFVAIQTVFFAIDYYYTLWVCNRFRSKVTWLTKFFD